MNLMDRFAAGLETLGKKANRAFDEGKLRVDLMRVRRRTDAAARDLGYVTYRQAGGQSAPEGEVEALTRRIADGEAEAKRIQEEIDKLRAVPPAEQGAAAP